MGASVLDEDEVDRDWLPRCRRACGVLVEAHWIDVVQSKLQNVSFHVPADDDP